MTLLAAFNTQTTGPDAALPPVSWHDAKLRRIGAGTESNFATLGSGQRQRSEATADYWQASEAAAEHLHPRGAQVRDAASASPRRRAGDAAQAPGFPSSGFVAQVLAQHVFPPNAVASDSGLAAYQATLLRARSLGGPGINLSV